MHGVKAYKKVCQFFGPPCMYNDIFALWHALQWPPKQYAEVARDVQLLESEWACYQFTTWTVARTLEADRNSFYQFRSNPKLNLLAIEEFDCQCWHTLHGQEKRLLTTFFVYSSHRKPGNISIANIVQANIVQQKQQYIRLDAFNYWCWLSVWLCWVQYRTGNNNYTFNGKGPLMKQRTLYTCNSLTSYMHSVRTIDTPGHLPLCRISATSQKIDAFLLNIHLPVNSSSNLVVGNCRKQWSEVCDPCYLLLVFGCPVFWSFYLKGNPCFKILVIIIIIIIIIIIVSVYSYVSQWAGVLWDICPGTNVLTFCMYVVASANGENDVIVSTSNQCMGVLLPVDFPRESNQTP